MLSDPSAGIISASRSRLADMAGAEFRQADAMKIAEPDHTVDVVVANHMLYEVPHRKATFTEVVRVLKPTGQFFATTNGVAHMRELDELIGSKAASLQVSAARFDLENGRDQLTPFFDSVELLRHQNPLMVTDSSAVVDYVESLPLALPAGDLRRIGQVVERSIVRDGALAITRDSGLFRCAEPHTRLRGRQHPPGLPAPRRVG